MKYSRDTRIDAKVRELVGQGWEVRFGGEHPKLISPGNRRIAIPSTPSDHRTALNWASRVRRLGG